MTKDKEPSPGKERQKQLDERRYQCQNATVVYASMFRACKNFIPKEIRDYFMKKYYTEPIADAIDELVELKKNPKRSDQLQIVDVYPEFQKLVEELQNA